MHFSIVQIIYKKKKWTYTTECTFPLYPLYKKKKKKKKKKLTHTTECTFPLCPLYKKKKNEPIPLNALFDCTYKKN